MNKNKNIQKLTLLEINGITKYLSKVTHRLGRIIEHKQVEDIENQIKNL